MTDIVIYTDIDLLLYGIAITLLFIASLQYIGMARKKENPNEKTINNAYGIVFIGLTIQFILLILYLLSLEGDTVEHAYRGTLKNIPLLSEWLYRMSWSVFFGYVTIFIYTFEKIRTKKMHISLLICIGSIVLMILLPFEILLTLGYVPITILYFYYQHVLFTLMKWAKKELKAATSFIIMGTVLIGTNLVFINPLTMRSGAISSIINPLLLIMGTILCMTPTFLKPEFFLRKISYWYLFNMSLIGGHLFLLVLAVILVPEIIIFGIIMFTFFTIEGIVALNSILKEQRASTKKGVDIVGVFTRPESITEEEVSVSKEKKICLVCKNEVSRANYICPDCKTFYCEKCSKALGNMENACWVCNSPIDPSKPIKVPQREEEEEVDVEVLDIPQKSRD